MANSSSDKRPPDPRHVEAVRLRIFEAKNWGEIAKFFGIGERTLYKWRVGDRWQDAVEEALRRYSPDAKRIAWERLVMEAQAGPQGVAAAKEILDRIDGAATQRHRHEGPNGGPLQVATVDVAQVVDDAETADLACALLERLGRGAHDSGGAGSPPGDISVPGGAAPEPAQQATDAPDGGEDPSPDGDDAAASREE